MSEIEITDENFKETRARMQQQSMDILLAIARRFKMKDVNSDPKHREELIECIVGRIKNVMVSKYQPSSYEELNKITKLLVDSLIQKPKSEGRKKRKSDKERKKIQDPMEKLKIRSMAGNFKASRVVGTRDRKI
jgi:hypothetical protein